MKTKFLFLSLLLVLVGVSLAQPPVNITYGNETLAPATNENGAILPNGSLIYVINCGPDMTINPPELSGPNKGLPTGDDFIIRTTYIGDNLPPVPGFEGKFVSSGQVFFQPTQGQTGVGHNLYIRFFNTNDRNTATYYGNSTTYTTTSINGQAMERTGQTNIPLALPMPSVVSGLTITRTGDGTVTLSWNPSNHATGYNIYRTSNILSWPTTPYSSSTTTTWTDPQSTQGTNFMYYRVTATN
ncbi:MAG: hypothetical protein N2450_00395 [bacterium]|nr:hypothetical protein [bacterium]